MKSGKLGTVHVSRRPSFHASVAGIILSAWALTFLSGCASAPKSEFPVITMDRSRVTASIREFGSYQITGQRRVVGDPRTPDKTLSSYRVESFSFETNTDEIPGVLNTHFGFTYQIAGLPPMGLTNAQFLITHPEIKSPDGRKSTDLSWTAPLLADRSGVVRSFMGYAFEAPYEIVPGEWIMHVFLGNKLLIRKTFRVSALQATGTNQNLGASTKVTRISVSIVGRPSPVPDYDKAFIDTIDRHLQKLLAQSALTASGEVVVEFKLNSNGRVRDLKVVRESVGESLTQLCKQAVTEPAPYASWGLEMIRLMRGSEREIRFTFKFQ